MTNGQKLDQILEEIVGLRKEVRLLKTQVIKMENDKWCEFVSEYYGNTMYKVKYVGGRVEIDYGKNLFWDNVTHYQIIGEIK